MRLRWIKVLALVAPAAGLVGYEVFRHTFLQPFLGEPATHFDEHILSGVLLLVAVVGFSFFIFGLLERLHDQLVAVNQAGIAVTADLSPDRVLERVAELARSVAGVPYASVRVGGEAGRSFASGAFPAGTEPHVLPIVVRGERLGELVLAAPAGRRLRATDRAALETFATQAGVAIENARLFERAQELVALRERARIGMDLHDGVVQELYGQGLKLEDAAELLATEPSVAEGAMRDVGEALRRIIAEIRAYVYDLRDGEGSVELGPALERLVGEFPTSDPAIALDLDGPVRLSAATAANVLHVVREAVANALRHGAASQVVVRAGRDGDRAMVRVEDDGRGFDPGAALPGLGLGDMRERARWCRCALDIRSVRGGGTTVELRFPVGSLEVVEG